MGELMHMLIAFTFGLLIATAGSVTAAEIKILSATSCTLCLLETLHGIYTNNSYTQTEKDLAIFSKLGVRCLFRWDVSTRHRNAN